MENAAFWHFQKKADFERALIIQGGKKKQNKTKKTILMKNSQPVLAVNKSVEDLLFNLLKKHIFGVKFTFPLLDLVC